MSFSKSFLWGVVSAVFHDERSVSNHDQYFREDVTLLKQMGIKAYRFTVSWSCIMPEEDQINEEGLIFYKNLVLELLEAGITPICTLCCQDLPVWLLKKGGWFSGQSSYYFVQYVEVVVAALSDKLPIWMMLHEAVPIMRECDQTDGHVSFETGIGSTTQTVEQISRLTRNILLANGKAVQVIREKSVLPPQVGIVLDGTLMIPWEETEEEIEKARTATFSRKADYHLVNWWLDPIVKGELHEQLAMIINDEERKVICQPLDFIGYNCYKANNYDNGRNEVLYPGLPRTAADWPITPEALYWAVRFFYERYQIPILISENGMANVDFVMSDGRIHDQQRIEYLKGYLKGLKRAAAEGYLVMGYLYCSFLDHLEWAKGYDKRFGLIFIDYQSGKRIPKDSALWYTKTIRENGAAI